MAEKVACSGDRNGPFQNATLGMRVATVQSRLLASSNTSQLRGRVHS